MEKASVLEASYRKSFSLKHLSLNFSYCCFFFLPSKCSCRESKPRCKRWRVQKLALHTSVTGGPHDLLLINSMPGEPAQGLEKSLQGKKMRLLSFLPKHPPSQSRCQKRNEASKVLPDHLSLLTSETNQHNFQFLEICGTKTESFASGKWRVLHISVVQSSSKPWVSLVGILVSLKTQISKNVFILIPGVGYRAASDRP